MNVLSSESIVLRQRDFKDRDRLVTFLTRDRGKLSGIAKGAKVITGRGVGAYEPFTRCVIHFAEKAAGGLVQIRKCDPLPPFLFPVSGYERFLHLTYYTELVELCSISAADSESFFQLLARTLERTAQAAPEQLPVQRLEFELDLLEVLGWQPEWKRCVHCGKPIFVRKDGTILPVRPAPHQFDAQAGGVRCPDCQERRGRQLFDLGPGALAQFAAWRAGRAEGTVPPGAPVLQELERAVIAHLLHHLERKPQSLDLLDAGDKELLAAAPASVPDQGAVTPR